MKINPLPALLTLTLFATGCSSMKATSERDKEFDFGQIKSYQWVDGPEEILDKSDTYINEDIQKALNTELVNRGLLQISDGAAADVGLPRGRLRPRRPGLRGVPRFP